ncbi:MAG: prepilin peptidase [Candidatus Moranbacteria bacterium]|nr:prepilin peptidase [Candidatus Moranbacteria bacterium]
MLEMIVFFIFGLIVGSFLNVVVLRTRSGQKISQGRSKCPKCKKIIKWHENIPVVSFVLLRGRCAGCKKKISWQYPLVEFSTGLLFAGTAWRFLENFSPEAILSTLFICAWVAIAVVIVVYDMRHMEIPMIPLWIGVGITLVYQAIMILTGRENILSVAIGGVVGFLLFWAMAYFSKEKWMGMGDAYVGLFMGVTLGWTMLLVGLWTAFIAGGIVAMIVLVTKMKSLKNHLPFAPFLLFGWIVALFFGEKMLAIFLGL